MKLKNIYIVLGPPGSGKGTQSEMLAKAFDHARIVLGDLIREFIKEDSNEAREAKTRYDAGTPQPDEIATMLLERKLKDITNSEGVVIDTYPLSKGQAEALEKILKSLDIKNLKVIFLKVNKDEVVKRIIGRKKESGAVARSDDDPEIAKKRFEEYEKRNAPIKDFYRNLGALIEIDGEQLIEKVHEDIIKKLND